MPEIRVVPRGGERRLLIFHAVHLLTTHSLVRTPTWISSMQTPGDVQLVEHVTKQLGTLV